MVDVDGNGILDLLAGNTAYGIDGSVIWQNPALPDGFTATGDFDKDGAPEIVLVKGDVWILDAATGAVEVGPVDIPEEVNRGGPPTVADFDVVYSDECFLRVLDGVTGELRFAAPNTTFTATEALIVADVDGDASAEIVRVSNSANWQCNTAPWINGDPNIGLPAWQPASDNQVYYRGISVFGASDSSWVGTRTLWSQHAYNVTNICNSGDSACNDPNHYGAIPTFEQPNWLLPWLNNFRQNVQDSGVFDAPNATVDLDVECSDPLLIFVKVRNVGLAPLPAGVTVEVRRVDTNTVVGSITTTESLFPGQIQTFELQTALEQNTDLEFVGEIVVDPDNATFVECKDDDNISAPAKAFCGIG